MFDKPMPHVLVMTPTARIAELEVQVAALIQEREKYKSVLSATNRTNIEQAKTIKSLTAERDVARSVLRDVVRMWGGKYSLLTEGRLLIERARTALAAAKEK